MQKFSLGDLSIYWFKNKLNLDQKATLCNTELCVTQGRFSCFFLVSLRISIFTLLEEIEDERGYPEIILSFPLYSRGGFGGYVVDNAVYALNLVYYAAGGGIENIIRYSRPIGGHKVAGHNRS